MKRKRNEAAAMHIPAATIYDLAISRKSSSWFARSLGSCAKAFRSIRQKITFEGLILWGTPIIIMAFLAFIGTR